MTAVAIKVGLALRSTVFSQRLVAELVGSIERSRIDSVWFPSVGNSFDALDMCGIALGESHRLRVASGVIRSGDYQPAVLLARVHTLSEASGGRFILGIGTGMSSGSAAIKQLVNLTDGLRSSYPEPSKPPIFFAALKRKMLHAAMEHADGALLNFCSPEYVSLIESNRKRPEQFTMGCYIKLFFAEEDDVADEMLITEVKMYDRFPQYHKMFERMGISNVLSDIDHGIPGELLKLARANPSDEEVMDMVKSFNSVGVDLPVIYPYVSGDRSYKQSVIERLVGLV